MKFFFPGFLFAIAEVASLTGRIFFAFILLYVHFHCHSYVLNNVKVQLVLQRALPHSVHQVILRSN